MTTSDLPRTRRIRLEDVWAACITVPLGLIGAWLTAIPAPSWLTALDVACGLVGGAALLLTNRHPWLAALFAGVASSVTIAAVPPTWYATFWLARTQRLPQVFSVVAVNTLAICFQVGIAIAVNAADSGGVDGKVIRVALLVGGILVAFNVCAAMFGVLLEVHDRRLVEAAHEMFVVLERQRHLAESVATAERERMRRTLHDGLGHKLALLSLFTEALQRPDQLTATEAQEVSETIRSQLDEAYNVLSETLRDVDPERPLLPEEIIRSIMKNLSKAGYPAVLRADTAVRSLPPEIAKLLVAFAREGITNAMKHSQRGPISVIIGVQNGALLAQVRSEPPRGAQKGRSKSTRLGIASLKSDAARFNGDVRLEVTETEAVLRLRVPDALPIAPSTGSTSVV